MNYLQAQPKGEFIDVLLVGTRETPKVTQSCQSVARGLNRLQKARMQATMPCPLLRERYVCAWTLPPEALTQVPVLACSHGSLCFTMVTIH